MRDGREVGGGSDGSRIKAVGQLLSTNQRRLGQAALVDFRHQESPTSVSPREINCNGFAWLFAARLTLEDS
jgi:hypothetical protein